MRRRSTFAPAVSALLVLVVAAAAATAQEAAPAAADSLGWHNSLVGSFNFTQTEFSNWAEGGTNSASWLVSAAGSFRRYGGPTIWSNALKLEYGETEQEGQDSRKSLDLIFGETIVDFNTSRLIKPYARASLKTQFASGYDYNQDPQAKVSDFADPLLLTQGAGVGFWLKPWLATRLGFGAQETFADEFAAKYTDDVETLDEMETSKFEGGLESVTTLEREFDKKLNVKSRLALFWAFNNSDQVDGDWMTDITLKALGSLGVTLKFQLLYNKDVLDKIQLKQVLGVGLSYAFI